MRRIWSSLQLFISRHAPEIVVFLIAGLLSFILVAWLKRDFLPPHWDMSIHLINALSYRDMMAETHGSLFGILELFWHLLTDYHYYPPLYYWLTLPLTLLSRNADILCLINIIFIFTLAFSSYYLARRLLGKYLALLSVVVVLSIPIVVSQTHQYQLDLPVTALVTLGWFLLLASENFKRRGYALWFGAVMGFAMLVKWPAVGFFVAPALWTIWESRKNEDSWSLSRRNIIHALVVFALVVMPWFGYNARPLAGSLLNTASYGAMEGDPAVFSWQSVLWYPRVFLGDYLRGTYVLPFIIGLGYYLKRSKIDRNAKFLMIALIGGYLSMTLFRNKDLRYIMPLCGITGILAVGWLESLHRSVRLAVSALIAVAAILLVYSVSFGIPWLKGDYTIQVTTGWQFPIFSQAGYFSDKPEKVFWPNEKILSDIVSNEGGRPVKIAMDYYNNPYFNRDNFNYYVSKNNFAVTISYLDIGQLSCDSDYLITLENGNGTVAYDSSSATGMATNATCKLTTVTSYKLPTGGTVEVYKVWL